jgi:hypothetical protein
MICLYFYEYSAVDQADAALDAMTTGAWLGVGAPYNSPDGVVLAEVWQPATGKYSLYNVAEKRILSDPECAAAPLAFHGRNADLTSSYQQAA